MSFRPFSLGDALLLQRLRNYSTPLQIERILLESISPVRTALRSRLPWYRHSSFTYVLRQEENGLAREGLIQLRIRPHSHEADVTLLSPALDAPQGHPAIWQKLLTYSAQHIFRQNVCRLFSDLPDQPLLVNTFRQAGFVPLTQVTIWRLDSAPLAPSESTLRPQRAADAPELERLYQRITPVPVQRLEVGLAPNQPDEDRISPILSNPHHVHISGYVLDDDRGRGLAGCVQILWGKRGAWIRLWTDTNDPRTHNARLLLGFALQRIYEAPHFHRAYISVRAYQTGLNALLSDYGFAPFTDRMLMVRNILQWRRRSVDQRMPALKAVQEAVPGSLAIPKFDSADSICWALGGSQTARRRLPLQACPSLTPAVPTPGNGLAAIKRRPLAKSADIRLPRAIAMRRPASRPRRPARGGTDTILNRDLQTTDLVNHRALAGLLKTKNQKLKTTHCKERRHPPPPRHRNAPPRLATAKAGQRRH